MTEDDARRAAMDGDWEAVARFVVRKGLARRNDGLWIGVDVRAMPMADVPLGPDHFTGPRYHAQATVSLDGKVLQVWADNGFTVGQAVTLPVHNAICTVSDRLEWDYDATRDDLGQLVWGGEWPGRAWSF